MPANVLNCFLACIRSIPVIFITAILLWSYYAYVVQLCLFTIDSVVEKVLFIIFYHPILVLMIWSYWKAIFTPIAITPKEFCLNPTDFELLQTEVDRAIRKEILDQVAKQLPVQCRLTSGEIRFCDKCKAIKPDRAHHCSICGKCVLKMDHHCPWVNNCVCFSNYKFFLLFLAYSLIYCLYVAFTMIPYFIRFFKVGAESYGFHGLHIVFLFIASLLFAVCLLTLFTYHCYLVAYNRSTIESSQPPVLTNGLNKDAFNIGCKNNFIEVFGERKLFWFLPIFTSYGDGCSYPSNCYPSSTCYQSLNTTTAITISETVDGTISGGMSYSRKNTEDDVHSLLGQQDAFDETVANQVYFINNVSEETS